MILRKIIIENFRQFCGRGEIRFAQPGDRNVTVILGQNGAGKTTLLNAFLWCLYERLDVENPNEIVCHKAIQEAAIGDEIGLSVTTIFSHDDRSYTVTRRATYQKQDGGEVEEVSSPEFRIDVMDAGGATSPAPDPKQLIKQILPEGLTGFFFFRGEEMETLALQKSGPNLADGVEEFLNFRLLDNAIKHLKQVGQDFEAELDKVAVGDMKRLTEEIAADEEDFFGLQRKLETERSNIKALEAAREEVDRELAEVDETRPFLEKKSELKQQKDGLIQVEEDARKRLAAVISLDGFLAGGESVLSIPIRLSDDAVRAGDLPSKVKPQFVDDLLKLGTCVACGRPLDDAARNHLVEWRGHEGLAALEGAINNMRGAVRALAGRRDRFLSDLSEARTGLFNTRAEINRVTGEISAIDSELQGKDFGLDYVHGLQSKLRRNTDDMIEKKTCEQRALDAVTTAMKDLENKREQRKQLAKDQTEAARIERQFDATRAVIQTLETLRRDWLTIVQEYLDGQLKENWKRVAQLDRLVEFTPSFHLSIKERGPDGAWTTSAPSSANLRALALCFVTALIKLAADIREDGIDRGDGGNRQQLFHGGDYPLVMDAPFATMDKHFKRTVPAGLRGVVPQMAILINHDQWSGEVDDMLRNSVGSAYVLELHTPGNDGSDSRVGFGGNSVDYVVSEPDALTDWSVIREVSI